MDSDGMSHCHQQESLTQPLSACTLDTPQMVIITCFYSAFTVILQIYTEAHKNTFCWTLLWYLSYFPLCLSMLCYEMW